MDTLLPPPPSCVQCDMQQPTLTHVETYPASREPPSLQWCITPKREAPARKKKGKQKESALQIEIPLGKKGKGGIKPTSLGLGALWNPSCKGQKNLPDKAGPQKV